MESLLETRAGPAEPAGDGRGGELDLEVLERARQGDEAALRELFRVYHRRVYAYLWRLFGQRANREQIEDLTQDTFLRVFAALPRFRPQGRARLSTWILTITHRLALNALRKTRNRERGKPLVQGPTPAAGGRADPDLDLRRRVRAAFEDLSDERRAVFLLADFHGLGPEEIGRVLDIPAGTAKSRLSRARAALRRALEDDHD